MNKWRFVLSGRWFRYFLLAVVFAVGCAGLASWQLARRAEKVAEDNRIINNYDATPVPLQDALPEADSFSPDQEWLPVTMTGRYQTADQLLVRNRPFNGDTGYEVLVPFETESGDVFLIDRGWVGVSADGDVPTDIPAPPAGDVTVVARLKAGEPQVAGGTTASGILASIQLPEISRVLDEPIHTGAYGQLTSETPPAADRPAAAARPQLDEGPHLSYAVQWVVFAFIGFGALVFSIRQEYRNRNADDPEEQRRAERREQRRATRRTDADEEDALLEAGR